MSDITVDVTLRPVQVTIGTVTSTGKGVLVFATIAAMQATTGTIGQQAVCSSMPDQLWMWSVENNQWVNR